MNEVMTERQQRRRSIITFGGGIDDREWYYYYLGALLSFSVYFAMEDDNWMVNRCTPLRTLIPPMNRPCCGGQRRLLKQLNWCSRGGYIMMYHRIIIIDRWSKKGSNYAPRRAPDSRLKSSIQQIYAWELKSPPINLGEQPLSSSGRW